MGFSSSTSTFSSTGLSIRSVTRLLGRDLLLSLRGVALAAAGVLMVRLILVATDDRFLLVFRRDGVRKTDDWC